MLPLSRRRPVDEPETMRGMLAHAGIIVTARARGLLVGISRAITDFHFCTYLSDLAVDQDYQRLGIGRELIRRTHEAAGLGTTPAPGSTHSLPRRLPTCSKRPRAGWDAPATDCQCTVIPNEQW